MAETPVYSDQQRFSLLKDSLKQKLLGDAEVINFFGLKEDRVRVWVDNVLFDDNEIRVSPGYMSAGWGHNQSTSPVIAQTDLGSSVQNYLHESRHGLHNLVCQTLFESEDALKNLGLFKTGVLGDIPFIAQIDKPGGSKLQERMLQAARNLCSKETPTKDDVAAVSWMLGALTYQHAYFVDPGLCEAVASFRDEGITWAVGSYNRWFATLLIPGEQHLEGYTNGKWQELFKKADSVHKALLVKKADYKRGGYFR